MEHKLLKISLNDDNRSCQTYATWTCKCGVSRTVTYWHQLEGVRSRLAREKAKARYREHAGE